MGEGEPSEDSLAAAYLVHNIKVETTANVSAHIPVQGLLQSTS